MLTKSKIDKAYLESKDLLEMKNQLGDSSDLKSLKYEDKNELRKALYEKYNLEKTDDYYFTIINPRSGLRYDIPGLSTADFTYFEKYVYFMKIKEASFDTFDAMSRWN